MRTFRYDPGKTFRGWLRRLCQSRAIDLLRKKNADAVRSLEDQPVESLLQEAPADIEAEEDAAAERPRASANSGQSWKFGLTFLCVMFCLLFSV